MTKRTPSRFGQAMKATAHAALTPAPAARPLAKSQDPQYHALTVYVPKATHHAVKAALIPEGRELSELVGELLAGWLKGKRG